MARALSLFVWLSGNYAETPPPTESDHAIGSPRRARIARTAVVSRVDNQRR
jgi:hypothetical protein